MLWGEFDEDDAKALIATWAFEERMESPYDVVADMSRLSFMTPGAFEAIRAHVHSRLLELGSRIRRHAMVHPPGFSGALIAGFYPVLGPRFEHRSFAEAREAFAWALGDPRDELRRELEALVPAALPDDVGRVRALLRAAGEDELTLAEVARRLGRSPRSLQRALAHAETSFRREQARIRIERARQLLEDTELKVEAVARAVGMRSPSSFVATFRSLTGATPTEYRRARSDARH